MRLLLQTAGVLAATVVIAHVVFRAGGPRRHVLACAAVASAVSAIVAFSAIESQGRQMMDGRETVGATGGTECGGAPCRPYAAIDDHRAHNQVGQQLGVNTAFIDWARQKLRTGDSYYLVMSPSEEVAAFPHWIAFRMLPYLATDIEGQLGNGSVRESSPEAAGRADWIIFYGVEPRAWSLRDRVTGRVQPFGRGFAVLRPDR